MATCRCVCVCVCVLALTNSDAQVMAKAFAIVQHLAEKAVKFSKRGTHFTCFTGTKVQKLTLRSASQLRTG